MPGDETDHSEPPQPVAAPAGSSPESNVSSVRDFLSSPAVIAQDEQSKRRFLETKGYNASDVNQLIYETVCNSSAKSQSVTDA